jgi:hypothetical protein
MNLVELMQALYQSRHLVPADQALYDKAWTAILAEPVEKAAVAALCQIALERQAGYKTNPLQLNLARVASVQPISGVNSTGLRTGDQEGKICRLIPALINIFSSMLVDIQSRSTTHTGPLHCGVDGILDQNNPVHSMEQLFCQAIALRPILITKIQCWAAVSVTYFCSAVTARDAVICSRNCRGGSSNADIHPSPSNDEIYGEYVPAGFVRWLDVVGTELQIGAMGVRCVGPRSSRLGRSY